MMKNRVIAAGWMVTILCLSGNSQAFAGFTFLGPIPYRSIADSPFNLSGLGSTFFLEDFEELFVLSPGLMQVEGGPTIGGSVDADDGSIDGQGYSGRGSIAAIKTASVAAFGTQIRFEFDSEVLGQYPTHVGLVLTSGGGPQSWITVYSAIGAEFVYDTTDLVLNLATVEDDRFVGFVNPGGIAAIDIVKVVDRRFPPLNFPVVDHVQFGIPEPSGSLLIATALAVLTFYGRRPVRKTRMAR